MMVFKVWLKSYLSILVLKECLTLSRSSLPSFRWDWIRCQVLHQVKSPANLRTTWPGKRCSEDYFSAQGQMSSRKPLRSGIHHESQIETIWCKGFEPRHAGTHGVTRLLLGNMSLKADGTNIYGTHGTHPVDPNSYKEGTHREKDWTSKKEHQNCIMQGSLFWTGLWPHRSVHSEWLHNISQFNLFTSWQGVQVARSWIKRI